MFCKSDIRLENELPVRGTKTLETIKISENYLNIRKQSRSQVENDLCMLVPTGSSQFCLISEFSDFGNLIRFNEN